MQTTTKIDVFEYVAILKQKNNFVGKIEDKYL